MAVKTNNVNFLHAFDKALKEEKTINRMPAPVAFFAVIFYVFSRWTYTLSFFASIILTALSLFGAMAWSFPAVSTGIFLLSYVAKKALANSARLGAERLKRAVTAYENR